MAWMAQKEEAAGSQLGLNMKQRAAKTWGCPVLNWSLLWSLQQAAVKDKLMLGAATALHSGELFRVWLHRQWHWLRLPLPHLCTFCGSEQHCCSLLLPFEEWLKWQLDLYCVGDVHYLHTKSFLIPIHPMGGIKLFLFPSSSPFGPSEWWFFWILMIFDMLIWFTISSYSYKCNPIHLFLFLLVEEHLCLGCWWRLILVPLYPSYSSFLGPLMWCPAEGALQVSKGQLQSWPSAEDPDVSLQSVWAGFVLNLKVYCEHSSGLCLESA